MPEPIERLLIVGASLAGVHAAEAARELGFTGELVLLDAGHRLPYDRPPLSKDGLRLGPEAKPSALRAYEWYADNGIELRLGEPATALDPQRREAHLADGSNISYDGLVAATGSQVRVPTIGGDCSIVRTLRTADDSADLHVRLHGGGRLVVVGAGFIGLEVASTAVRLGLEVTVVEAQDIPLAHALSTEAGTWLRGFHERHGVTFHCGTTVRAVRRAGDRARVWLSDGTELTADHIVAGVGVRPATDWLSGSGVELADGVSCDAALRTSVPGVVAAGDLAHWPNELFGTSMRVQHWTNAVEQGAHAVRTLFGDPRPYAPVPSFWSDQFDARLRFVGVTGTRTHTVHCDEESLVMVFGSDGVLRGALCVNATHRLPKLRAAIASHAPWAEYAPTAAA